MSSPSVGGLAVICDARLESSAKLRLGKTIVRLARANGPNKVGGTGEGGAGGLYM